MTLVLGLLRRILKIALALVAVAFVMALGVLLFVAFTPFGSRMAAESIAAIASTPERKLTLSPPQGLLGGDLRVERLTLSDRSGPYAEIEGIGVDWSPAALLGGLFKAETITVDSVNILRAPDPQEAVQASGGSGFSLPVGIQVASIDLPEINLSRSVSGRDFSLSLQGAVDATGPDIRADLKLARRDEPLAQANADIVFAPSQNRLTLSARLFEPEGGLLANLLNLPNAPSVDLTLDGEGPLSDWAGRLEGSVGGTPVIALQGRHMLAGENRYRVELDGGGDLASLLPPTFRPFFSGTTRIDVAAGYTPAGRVEIERGELNSGAARVSAKGVWDPADNNNLVASMTVPGATVDLDWPLGGQQARIGVESLHFTLTGAAASARFNATAALARLELPQARLSNIRLQAESENLDITRRSGRIGSRVSVGGMDFTDPNIARVIRGPFTLDAPLHLALPAIGLDAATFDSPELNGTLSGAFDIDRQSVTGNFRIFANPAALPPAIAEKFNGKISAEGYVESAGAGHVKLENFSLRSGSLEAHGNLRLQDAQIDARLAGRLPDLRRWLNQAEGAAGFDIQANGAVAAPDVKAVINSASAELAGRSLRDISIRLDGRADIDAPSGSLRTTGSIEGQPLRIAADIASSEGTASVPAIDAEIGPNRITGALNFSADFLPQGQIDFNFPDISLIAALAGQQAEGDLAGAAVFDNAGGKASAVIRANGSRLGRDAIAIERPAVDLAIADLSALAASGSITAARAGTGAAGLDAVELRLEHAGSRTGFALSARHDGAPLAAQGALNAGERISVALDSFSAAPRNIPIRLAAPTRIEVADGGVRMNGLTLATGNGSVAITGLAGTALDLVATIRSLPASLINAFVPAIDAAGSISGEIRASGTPSAPLVRYDLQWNDAQLRQTREAGLAGLNITASGNLAGDRLVLDTRLSGNGGLTLSGGGGMSLAGNRPLDMAFSGRLPFALLAGPLAAQGFQLEGSGNIDVKLAGSAAAPAINGTLSTAGARLIDVRRNLAVEDINASVALAGDRAVISQMTGRLSGGGTLAISGSVGLAGEFPADLAVRLDNASYADGNLVAVSANGNLALTGPLLGGPLLGGRLSLSRAAITVPARLPSSLAAIDIRHRNAPPAVARQAARMQPQEASTTSRPIRLDLTINADNGIFVRGRGIDAELGGSIAVGGTATEPQVSGGFQMRRGRIVILSRRLDFTSGTITFGGGLIPVLDLAADSNSSGTVITVNVAGVANDPAITFSSTPSLPEDEVLAQLIFGQSMSRLSPLQIAQLADAVSQLAGGSSTSLLERLRSGLGVDDLDINTDSSGQTTVSAGRRLNKRTYIQVEQGGESGAKATINLDIGRGVKLKAGAGSEGGNAGIFFEREY